MSFYASFTFVAYDHVIGYYMLVRLIGDYKVLGYYGTKFQQQSLMQRLQQDIMHDTVATMYVAITTLSRCYGDIFLIKQLQLAFLVISNIALLAVWIMHYDVTMSIPIGACIHCICATCCKLLHNECFNVVHHFISHYQSERRQNISQKAGHFTV